MREIWHWQFIWESIFSASEVFTTKNKVKLFDFWTHHIPRSSQVGGKSLSFSCLKRRLWAFLSASFVFLVPKVFSWNISLFNFPSSSDTIVDKCWKLFAQVEQGPPSTAAAAWLLNSCSEGGGDDELFEKWKWNRPATVRCPFQVAHQPPRPPPLVYLVAKVNIRGRAGWLSSHLGPPPSPPPVSQRQRPNCQQRPNFPSAASVVILLLPFLHKILPPKLPYCPYHQQTLKTQIEAKLSN